MLSGVFEVSNLKIGQPVRHTRTGEYGYIVAIEDKQAKTFLLGAGMKAIEKSIDVIFNNDMRSNGLDEHTVNDWVVNGDCLSTAQMTVLFNKNKIHLENIENESMSEQARADTERKVFLNSIKMPENAKAVIIAEKISDDSDSMTDYHGSNVVETLILAWSTHRKDLFPEMRKASQNAKETIHLVNAPESAEHSEKYSMGGGYYLKDGYRHSSGWRVSKQRLYKGASDVPTGRICIKDSVKIKPRLSTRLVITEQYSIEKYLHTKKQTDIFVCVIMDKLDTELFNSERVRCNEMGGYYTRKWNDYPGGFTFKTLQDAKHFVNGTKGDDFKHIMPANSAHNVKNIISPTQSKQSIVDFSMRFNKMAASMKLKIEAMRTDKLTNTPKRIAQVQHALNEASHLERTMKAMILLADLYESNINEFNKSYSKYTTKKSIYDALYGETETVQNGYHCYHLETGKPAKSADKKLWDLVGGLTNEQLRQQAINRKVNEMKLIKIPGYFPTHVKVIDKMIAKLDITAGCSILEPSAGNGSIVDRVLYKFPTVNFKCIELLYNLTDIIKLKHQSVEVITDNFMSVGVTDKFDIVMMNPPFENAADVNHVMRAFEHLKPGGRLVSIMSTAFTFRDTHPYSLFKSWLKNLDHCHEMLPTKSFKDSGTNIDTILLTINKGDV